MASRRALQSRLSLDKKASIKIIKNEVGCRDVGIGLRKIVACCHSSLQCLLVSTVFGTVSSLHPTSFLMLFILVYINSHYTLCHCTHLKRIDYVVHSLGKHMPTHSSHPVHRKPHGSILLSQYSIPGIV